MFKRLVCLIYFCSFFSVNFISYASTESVHDIADYENDDINILDNSFQRIWFGNYLVQDRKDKKVQITAEYLCVDYLTNELTRGGKLGYFLSSDYFFYLQLESSIGFKNNFINIEEEKISTRGLGIRKFALNTLYIDSGINLRTVSYSEESMSKYQDLRGRSEFESEVTVGKLAIGNQWYWKNMSFGVEWLGLSVPLFSRIKSETIEGNQNQYEVDWNQRQRRRLTKYASVRVLNISLGLAF